MFFKSFLFSLFIFSGLFFSGAHGSTVVYHNSDGTESTVNVNDGADYLTTHKYQNPDGSWPADTTSSSAAAASTAAADGSDSVSGIKAAGAASRMDVHKAFANASPECQVAFNSVESECTTGFGGVGSSIATVMQLGAGAAAAGVAGSCNGAKIAGGMNLAGDAVMGTMCYMKKSACDSACSSGTTTQAAANATIMAACNSAFNSFLAQAGLQGGMAALTMARGGSCNNETAANNNQNVTTPPGYNPPGFNEPANKGLTPLAPNQQSQGGGDSGGGSGGGGLPSSAYPGGAPGAQANGKGDGSGLNNPALGLAGGSGGGGSWPGGAGNGGGGGWPGGKNDGIDLSALLPGQKGDPSRNPASVNNEVTGAYDLTNFQKVTRMMNKKRPVLKNGEGA